MVLINLLIAITRYLLTLVTPYKQYYRYVLVATMTVFSTLVLAEKQTITVWNYYLTPPFKTAKNSGLVVDFVALLNKKYSNNFSFKLTSLPRARLNNYLAKGQQGILLFANKAWLETDDENRYLWTETLLTDQNDIISTTKNKIEYHQPESLAGYNFGGVRGRIYPTLEALMTKKIIKRYDVNNEQQVLNMLLLNRVDVTSQPRSIVKALAAKMGISKQLFFSSKPLFTFERRIMVTKQLPELQLYLNQIISTLAQDDDWLKILADYSLTNSIPPT